jgi:hypothetical protein
MTLEVMVIILVTGVPAIDKEFKVLKVLSI